MSITTLTDWNKVEALAKAHECRPTVEQQLVWSTETLARAKASLLRKDGCIATALMYLSIGCPQRAQEALNRGLLDL